LLFCFVLIDFRFQAAVELLGSTDGRKLDIGSFLRTPPLIGKGQALQWLGSALEGEDFSDVLVEGDCYRARTLTSFVTEVYQAASLKGAPLSRVELVKLWFENQCHQSLLLAKMIAEKGLSVYVCVWCV
jgi:hypothetical protein